MRRFEGQTVREKSYGFGDGGRAALQLFVVDVQLQEPVGPEVESFDAKLEQRFEEAVLRLEVLRGEERPLGPEHWLQNAHAESPYHATG